MKKNDKPLITSAQLTLKFADGLTRSYEVTGPRISGDGRARTINDLPENRARQFLNETRAKEILIAALQKKEPVIGTRPANKKTRKKVNKLRV